MHVETDKVNNSIMRTLVAASVAALASGAAPAQDLDSLIAPAVEKVNTKYAEYNLDIKKLFAAKCSWCHQGYGMKQADGPKLAGTEKTLPQVVKQITNQGADAIGNTPAEFAAFIASEIERYGKIVRAAGVKVQ